METKMDLRMGDCYKLIKEIPDKSIDCVYTDIPYLMHIGGGGRFFDSKARQQLYQEDLVPIIQGIDYLIIDELIRVLKRINMFIWCSKDQINDIINLMMEKCANTTYTILVWCKTNPIPFSRNTWLPDIEYCLYFKEDGVLLNDGTEWKSKWYVSKINQSDKALYDHPTIKPWELVKRHIQHTTQEGDTVLDPFMGSGTTGFACKQCGRNFIGFEIEEKYFNIAHDRVISEKTQRQKEKEEGGQMDIWEMLK